MDRTKENLSEQQQQQQPPDETSLDPFKDRSREFGERNPYPIRTNLCRTMVEEYGYDERVLLGNINGSYPLLHEEALVLVDDFLALKRRAGSEVEKALYADMSLPQFVDRLLTKRPLTFMKANDTYLLRDQPGKKGAGGFESIGTKRESPPLLMKDYLTYEEMKLSALLATCSPTCTVNSGERKNDGVKAKDGTFIRDAYIVGVVGTRLVKLNVMESQDIRINQEQNVKGGPFFGKEDDDGGEEETIGKIFARFYKVPYFPLYQEVQDLLDTTRGTSELSRDHFVKLSCSSKGRGRSKKLKTQEYFHKFVYEQRIRITAETLLMEANHRAEVVAGGRKKKKAYVHVVGLGLGVWKLTDLQHGWYVDVFGDCLKRLSLPHISDLDFSWIPVKSVLGVPDGNTFPNTNIKIHISKRNPYDPLAGAEDKIVVVSWAYDGNSYPGNEYWKGMLHSSGDSAAACATQVPELHNPQVNLKMSGSNLHIATKDGRVVPLGRYMDERGMRL